MTLAEKLAALPPKNNVTARQWGVALNARLALLLETVRAIYDAEDAFNKHFALDKERDVEWDMERSRLYFNKKAADYDLRTVQAHLEGERT